jgi:transcriptional regulator with XRE-family HTH domain
MTSTMARGGWLLDGRRVQKERLEKGWTVEQLAHKAGISERRLRDIEKSRETVAMQSTILCLAKCFGIPATELASPPVAHSRAKAKVESTSTEAPVPKKKNAPIGPMHEQTQLERLVAIEEEAASRQPLRTPEGVFEPLTARAVQEIFTAYTAHAGARFYATGKVLTHRGLAVEEANLYGGKRGISSRVLMFTPIQGENGLSFTVHTRVAEHTLFLQKKKGLAATVIVRVVPAPEEAVEKGTGFTFFQSKTPREWALIVEEVHEPAKPPGGERRKAAKRPKRRA